MNSAEKLTNVGHSEIQFTQFPKSFPSTSTGPPGLGLNSSPMTNWLGSFTKELKVFFETLARKQRAETRSQIETQQRLSSIEQWIRGTENCISAAMDSESQQIGLLKVLLKEVLRARRQDIKPEIRKPFPMDLNDLNIDELERLGSLALHTAQKRRNDSQTYRNDSPETSPRNNLYQRRRGQLPSNLNLNFHHEDFVPHHNSTQNNTPNPSNDGTDNPILDSPVQSDKNKEKQTPNPLHLQEESDQLPEDFYLNDYGDINPKYLLSPIPDIDPRYEQDEKYETGSQYDQDSEYEGMAASDSEDENTG